MQVKMEIPILKPLVGIFEIRLQMIKWEQYTEKFANISRINLLRFKSYWRASKSVAPPMKNSYLGVSGSLEPWVLESWNSVCALQWTYLLSVSSFALISSVVSKLQVVGFPSSIRKFYRFYIWALSCPWFHFLWGFDLIFRFLQGVDLMG